MSEDMISPISESAVPSVEDEAYEPQTYDAAFPALKSTQPSQPIIEKGRWSNKFVLRPTKCTQIFTVPMEERRFKDQSEHNFGGAGEQEKICKDIMQKTQVSIEMSQAKDQSLTVVITGKEDAVMKAKRMVVSQLQTQALHIMKIPREHHRFILGAKGKKLQELELATATKINIPRTDDNSDQIRVTGTHEGINRARHEIQCISDEQAKLAFERITVDFLYHPFVCGPYQNTIKQLMEETGVRINVPPHSVMKSEIVISGEKEGVMYCKAYILGVYEEKKKKCHNLSIEVKKSQHKYVIGPKRCNINEILQETGVSVEVPPSDSSSDTITLRGEQQHLGAALTMVYAKANSIEAISIDADAWLHRYIIGRGGSNIQAISQQFPTVHIEFTDGENKIKLEGPKEEIGQALERMEAVVADLNHRMTFVEIEIPQKFHRHVIGKAGSNISKIKKNTGVVVDIPADSVQSDIIRIEGTREGVASAQDLLLQQAHRMENEKTRDVLIEHRFHSQLIGSKGEKIREIRDKYPDVQITFPDLGKKSDVVTLRGPRQEVDKCHKYLSQVNQTMIVNNYQSEVKVFKQYHKNVIGKGGSNIKKIREETNTMIELPFENSESDIIKITGRREDVEMAKTKIENIQKDLVNVKEITLEIPHKYHNSIIGAKGRLIRSIMDECGGVLIRFPQGVTSSDSVVIRGPKDDVENAKRHLLDLANEKELSSFTTEIQAKPEYHKFLIGKGGSNIRKVRESTGARIIFPLESDPDNSAITIVGKQKSVEDAKAQLETLIKELENVVETSFNIDPKYHRHFVIRRGEVLKHISDDFGGVAISFPRNESGSDRVVIKGAKDCVEGAKRRLQEIVEDLSSKVSLECIIPQRYHRTVMGAKGSKVQEITRTNKVTIKFPDKFMDKNTNASSGQNYSQNNQNSPNYNPTSPNYNPTSPNSQNGAPLVNGIDSDDHLSNGLDDQPVMPQDIVMITGKQENCEAAKEALLALVPITVDIAVPFTIHRFIIGQQGKEVRRIMEQFDVSISVPPSEEHSDFVTVTGPPQNVERTRAALEDKVLQNFQITLDVDASYHGRLIGRKRAIIGKVESDYSVNIQFPMRNDPNQNYLTITGYENGVKAAKKDVEKLVQDMENMVTLDVELASHLHSIIIGAKGRRINKIMDTHKVDVHFPRAEDENPNTVTITGQEDNVYDCRDEILNIAEEQNQLRQDQAYMESLQRAPSRTTPHTNGPHDAQAAPKAGFVVKNAPWDTASTLDFPSIGGAIAPKQSHTWGPRKK